MSDASASPTAMSIARRCSAMTASAESFPNDARHMRAGMSARMSTHMSMHNGPALYPAGGHPVDVLDRPV